MGRYLMPKDACCTTHVAGETDLSPPSVLRWTDASALRSGARKLARGTRFFRTPGIETHQESHPARGARSPRDPFRVRIPELPKYSRGTQKTRTLANFPAPLRGALHTPLSVPIQDVAADVRMK